jgi:aminoglycoside phosphotransferase (APT) family kinase protein
MDPGIEALLDRKAARISAESAYQPLATADVEKKLRRFFAVEKPGMQVRDVARMGGGASKEQFVFTLADGAECSEYVLRMDPVQTAAETDRQREFEVLNAYSAHVPAPRGCWLDQDGSRFGQPAAIMNFLEGVTKPTAKSDGPSVTGIGTSFPRELREKLAPQFVAYLAKMHNVKWSPRELPSFSEPKPGTTEAALWQVNWMTRVWRDDHVQASPIAAIAERWLRQHLPVCEEPVMIHGDYRTGNFLFDEDKAKITAILDWEWAHLGDFHEDLGWMLQDLYMTHQDGKAFACGLMERAELIEAYEAASGRVVNHETLRWYEIYCAFKCYTITLATSIKAARDGANHQDVLLSWMAPVGYRFATELCSMIREEVKK